MTAYPPMDMTLQERMALVSFACKSAEMMERPLPPSQYMDLQQWDALRTEAVKVLARLDSMPENSALLPVPHDGVRWAVRK